MSHELDETFGNSPAVAFDEELRCFVIQEVLDVLSSAKGFTPNGSYCIQKMEYHDLKDFIKSIYINDIESLKICDVLRAAYSPGVLRSHVTFARVYSNVYLNGNLPQNQVKKYFAGLSRVLHILELIEEPRKSDLIDMIYDAGKYGWES